MKIFYHNDLDGHCAGSIAYKRTMERYGIWENDGRIQLFEMAYGKPFPFDQIYPNEPVIIVDYSLQKDGEFTKLLKITEDVTWIDHHKTAIDTFGVTLKGLPGLRSTEKSACELAWDYFYPDSPVPVIVQYIGDFDIWAWKLKDTAKVIEGLKVRDTQPKNKLWWFLYLGNTLNALDDIINDGEICLKYRDLNYEKLIRHLSFEMNWLGYHCIACNCAFTGSQVFDSVKREYDLKVTFYFDGQQWTVSLYSESVDCGAVAKSFGGGGHKGASGFQCKELPFLRGE